MWPPTLTPCECPFAGWCERHRCHKPPAFHQLCRRQIEYFQAWEEGRGPRLRQDRDPADTSKYLIETTSPPHSTNSGEIVETADGLRNPGSELMGVPCESGPGLIQRALNLGKAVTRHVVNRGRVVDDESFHARLAICRECSSCDTDRLVCRHPACGCFLNIKARWQSESCPLAKWPDITAEPSTPLV